MATVKRKVVIVGAGMAGLSAAAELSRSGLCEVIVLEAMDRPGGRIQTVTGFASSIIELGAQWLHGTKGNPVYDLAKKHDLLDKSSSESSSDSEPEEATWFNHGDAAQIQYRMEGGQIVHQKIALDAKNIFAAVQEKLWELDSEKLDSNETSVDELMRAAFAERLKQRGIGGDDESHQYWLIYEYCCRMEALDLGCNSLDEVQWKSYNYYEHLEGDYYTSFGKDGYQGVLEKLLADIPTMNVHYNTPVTQIRYTGCGAADGIVVKCEDGRTFSCSHVIVTASVGFLRENLETFFEPALPKHMQEALKMFQYGTVNKIFLKFDKPFWTSEDFAVQILWEPATPGESEQSEKGRFYRMLTGFDAEDKNKDVLMAWTYGKGAEFTETLTDEEIGQRCADTLRSFLQDPTIPEPDKVLCTRWYSNKYQRGSYGAFLSKQASGNEYGIMTTPVYCQGKEGGRKVPVLLFAGEAFHKTYFSTSHGAMQSGLDQAKVLGDFLSQS